MTWLTANVVVSEKAVYFLNSFRGTEACSDWFGSLVRLWSKEVAVTGLGGPVKVWPLRDRNTP